MNKLQIKKLREDLGLGFAEFALKIGVNQRTVERWEKNEDVQPRGETRKRIEALLRIGNIVGDARFLQHDYPVLQSDNDFFLNLDQWTDSWSKWHENAGQDRKQCDFYFFEPELLPVFANQSVQERWIENLEKNINYNLFWVLSGVSERDFSRRYGVLNAIAGKAPSMCKARLKVWGLDLGFTEDEVLKKYDAAKDAASNGEEDGVFEIMPILNLEKSTDWVRFIRLGGFSPLMVARVRPDFSTDPDKPFDFAARRFEDVSLIVNGTSATGWLHLSSGDTDRIISIIDSVLEN